MSDDTATVQAILDAAVASKGIAHLAEGRTYQCSGTLNFDASNAGFEGHGAWIHSLAPIGIKITTGQNSYTSGVIRDLRMVGNNRVARSIGVLIAGNHLKFDSLVVEQFDVGVQTGNYAYSICFDNPYIFANNLGVYLPGAYEGTVDSGEQIVFHGGSIFNGTNGIFSNAGVSMHGTSIDGMTGQSIVHWGGVFRGFGMHIENFQSPTGAIIENAGGNDYCQMEFYGLEVFQDTGTAVLKYIKNPGAHANITFTGGKFSGQLQ